MMAPSPAGAEIGHAFGERGQPTLSVWAAL
jgi:hypothetical protein